MKFLYSAIMLLMPCLAFAASNQSASMSEQLFLAILPVLLIVLVFYIIGKKAKNINQQLLESNLEIAAQIKRVADHLEKTH